MSIKDQIHKTKKQWYVAHCKYNCEKRLYEDLKSSEISSYVPLRQKIVPIKSGKKITLRPLIPSHIFIYIDQSEYLKVLQHPHVFQFLNFSGKIHPIPEKEMELMKWVVGERSDINVSEVDLNVGDEVTIINGELTGLRGVLSGKNNYNFKVVIESLSIGLEIYVDPKYLMKTGSKLRVA